MAGPPEPAGGRPRTMAALACFASLAAAGLACARADVQATVTPHLTEAARPSSEPTELTPSPIPSTQTSTVTPTPGEPEPVLSPTFPPTPTFSVSQEGETVLYAAQSGDTLRAIAVRFGVLPVEIRSDGPLPQGESGLIDPGQLLFIPRRLAGTGPADRLIPDSEVVDSPHAADFDAAAATQGFGGFLQEYEEFVGSRTLSGAEVVQIAARDNSFNPRLLLAMLEYLSGWVTDPTRPSGDALRYPLGVRDPQIAGLYRQLTWLSNALGEGYYGWRSGVLTEIHFADGSAVRLAPELNAGTVALQYALARFVSGPEWQEAVSPDGFVQTYRSLLGDPWGFEHPLYEPGLEQPEMILPFLPGRVWSYSGGPHGAWEREAAWAALDFSPPSVESGCVESGDWVVAVAPGLVIRSERGVVILDLDGDGREQTGWVILYLHIATRGRVAAGAFVEQGDLIGHPSCEGGIASGTHVHIARKYNGEWILADGPLPFNLSGWTARAGARPYQGALVRGAETVLACPCGSQETWISR